MPDLLFFLILGHLVGDFAFQSDWVAQHKKSSVITLTYHVLIYTLTIACFLGLGLYRGRLDDFFATTTLLVLTALFVEHWFQDFIRSRWFSSSKQGFYLDQVLHVAVLFLIRLYVYPS